MLVLGLALADNPITWETLNADALAVFEDGPGASVTARARAARDAVGAVAVGPTAVRAEAQVGLPAQRQALAAVEMPLGVGRSERRWLRAEATARLAEVDSARFTWVRDVQEAWLAWWTASEIAEHLEDYARDVEDDLQGFESAVSEGVLAPLTLEDLRAESLQVRAEAAAMEQTSAVAAAHLRSLLGERALDAGGHALHDAEPGMSNPWTPLVGRAGDLPAVREAAAREDAARRQVAALGASRTPVLAAGPMWGPDDGGTLRSFAFVGVSMPLQPGVGPDRRVARGEVAAAAAERRWQERSLDAHLEQEALAWDAGRARLQRLRDEVLGPLEARQERLEGALSEGLVTADRVVRARRERHEAEHEQVLVAGELLASAARASLLAEILAGDVR
ncbi:MAG: TolC family protein [Alphaproteobacteria bacterium]|nr:TolC family protein [Alphaproteobacteria bacterium]MCB9691678.1 TolC family protein [Alphaproteobacteria bacterium]